MKKLAYLFSIIAGAFLLMGCPYESAVPIDSPTMKYPAAILGKWEPKSSSEDLYTIQKKNEYYIVITKTKKEPKPDDSPEVYEAFISNVAGTNFLNLYEKKNEDDGSKKFYLYKLEISSSGARLTLSEISENVDEKFDNSAALKGFIEKNMMHSFFFGKDDEVYIRAD